MGEGSPRRRLAAILAADVAGYSRLMGEDEEGTLAILKAYREIIDERRSSQPDAPRRTWVEVGTGAEQGADTTEDGTTGIAARTGNQSLGTC